MISSQTSEDLQHEDQRTVTQARLEPLSISPEDSIILPPSAEMEARLAQALAPGTPAAGAGATVAAEGAADFSGLPAGKMAVQGGEDAPAHGDAEAEGETEDGSEPDLSDSLLSTDSGSEVVQLKLVRAAEHHQLQRAMQDLEKRSVWVPVSVSVSAVLGGVAVLLGATGCLPPLVRIGLCGHTLFRSPGMVAGPRRRTRS